MRALAASIAIVCLLLAIACSDGSDTERLPDDGGTASVSATRLSPTPGQPIDAPTASPSATTEGVPISEMQGDLADDFQTVRDIARASEAIVVAKAVDSRSTVYGGIPFTILTMRVEQTLAGDIQKDAIIEVVETGGPLAGRSKEDGSPGEAVEVAFEGVRVMKVGERWVLFLSAYDFEPVASGAYSVEGVFQGKFRIGDDERIVFTGPEEKLVQPLFSILADVNGRPLDDVLAEVEDSLAAEAASASR